MDIGEPQRIITVEPAQIPIPQREPAAVPTEPFELPAHQPEPQRVGE